MEARVIGTNEHRIVRALEGREYVKTEWRPVPADREDEAERHPMLEIRTGKAKAKPQPQQPTGGEGESVGEVQTTLETAGVNRADHFAGLLAGAGLDTVSKVRGLEKSDLTAIKGIGDATADKILAAVGADPEV